ncbi:unnamed protein product [Fusarium graminearum]|nr:hypothetical protein FG05_01269 [Fusarium graminearum]CZS76645.1 unnamed protein product [Fusarium graminearum]
MGCGDSLPQGDLTYLERSVILSCLHELQSQEGKARVERLFLMEGGEHVAVILLLDGEDSMLGFSNVQAEWLCWDYAMPIIPINTIETLPGCLESLQQDYSRERSPHDANTSITSRDLVRWCVNGKALSRDQVNILTEITSGFGDLTSRSSLPSGQAIIREYLGSKDGGRLISFLTNDFPKAQG